MNNKINFFVEEPSAPINQSDEYYDEVPFNLDDYDSIQGLIYQKNRDSGLSNLSQDSSLTSQILPEKNGLIIGAIEKSKTFFNKIRPNKLTLRSQSSGEATQGSVKR